MFPGMRLSNVILIFAVIAFVAFVFYSLERVEPLKVTGGHIEHQGSQVLVRGTVTNTGSQNQVAGLQLSLFDGSGHLITRQDVRLTGLSPGQSEQFTSPPISAAGAEKFTIQIDRGNNMYGN
jgi:hypothetical protein